jgi:aminopeptidase N
VDPAMKESPHAGSYQSYFALVKSGLEEPMTTHSDHFETNFAYSIASYSKGEVFLEQLGYIVGAAVRDQILLDYYNQWKFKHPNVHDFIRVAEKRSGIELDWYQEYWVNTTKTIDYGIDSLFEQSGTTNIRLKRTGKMPMPIDVVITFRDGTKELHYVPMYLMFGTKPVEDPSITRKVYDAWKWTHPTFQISTNRKLQDIKSVEIDPSGRMADVNPRDNKLELNW